MTEVKSRRRQRRRAASMVLLAYAIVTMCGPPPLEGIAQILTTATKWESGLWRRENPGRLLVADRMDGGDDADRWTECWGWWAIIASDSSIQSRR